jgi:hypothetical protein
MAHLDEVRRSLSSEINPIGIGPEPLPRRHLEPGYGEVSRRAVGCHGEGFLDENADVAYDGSSIFVVIDVRTLPTSSSKVGILSDLGKRKLGSLLHLMRVARPSLENLQSDEIVRHEAALRHGHERPTRRRWFVHLHKSQHQRMSATLGYLQV